MTALKAGTALLVKMPAPATVEAAGHAGFDLVVLDTEHGPANGVELDHHLRAADAAGVPALVRVPSLDAAAIGAALDAGAVGVVVPHVLDAAGAEAAVAAAHYPPRGRRGIALSTRAGRYGAVALDDHLRRAAEETCVVVQIEDAEAVPRSAEILAVDGVSAVLIGVADLSLSLGHPGSPPHPEVDAAITEILGAARAADRPVITVAANPEAAREWRARGATTVAFVASGLMHDALAGAVRGAAPRAGAPGDKEPLVLLPGMLCDASLWDGVAPELLPHAGPRPGRIDLDGSVGEMAESVLAGAPDRFALAGHSLGAIVALEIMRRAPARVTRLALLNASARGPSEAQRSAWAGLRERVERGEFQATASDLARSNLPTERRSDAGMVERCERMAHAIGAAGLLRQLAAQDDRPDSRASLGSIRVPTLVLSGAQDEVCPPALQAELAAGIPGAEHVTVEGAGHMAALEEPEAVAGHLAAWLDR